MLEDCEDFLTSTFYDLLEELVTDLSSEVGHLSLELVSHVDIFKDQ